MQRVCLCVLYSFLNNKLNSGGINRDEFEEIKSYPIADKSVDSFVSANIDMGNIKWEGARLVSVKR